MNLKVAPLEPEHFEKMKIRSVFRGDERAASRILACRGKRGYVMGTVLKDEAPIAVVGLTIFYPGVAEVWSVTSEDVAANKFAFHKFSLRLLDVYTRHLSLWRVQMAVKSDFKTGQRWARALGFQPEGTMKKFGPDGSDHILYARTR